MVMSLKSVLEKVEEKGTYVCVDFDEDTCAALAAYIKENDIPNPVDTSEFHTTIIYSRKSIAWKPDDDVDVEATVVGVDVFDTRDGKRCLVLLLECPWLHQRFERGMSLGATYDFPDYKPHITLSYDLGDKDPPTQVPDFPIHIVAEHMSDLKD